MVLVRNRLHWMCWNAATAVEIVLLFGLCCISCDLDMSSLNPRHVSGPRVGTPCDILGPSEGCEVVEAIVLRSRAVVCLGSKSGAGIWTATGWCGELLEFHCECGLVGCSCEKNRSCDTDDDCGNGFFCFSADGEVGLCVCDDVPCWPDVSGPDATSSE